MIRSALIVTLALVPTFSLAQQRPSTIALACRTAAGLVAQQGAIVLGTGGFTYERFVRDVGFCQREETTEPAWAPAADTPQCLVGYRCKSRNEHRGDGGGRD